MSITSPREKEIKITVLEQKILRVNLSEKSIVEEYIPAKVTEKYIGGKGRLLPSKEREALLNSSLKR